MVLDNQQTLAFTHPIWGLKLYKENEELIVHFQLLDSETRKLDYTNGLNFYYLNSILIIPYKNRESDQSILEVKLDGEWIELSENALLFNYRVLENGICLVESISLKNRMIIEKSMTHYRYRRSIGTSESSRAIYSSEYKFRYLGN